MADPDFSSFTVWKRGRQFEDFTRGQIFDHHWGRTLTRSDATLFASVTHRYCPIYFNLDYAKSEGHRDLVVDPLLVLATVIGLSVEDLSEAGGPFLGVNQVNFAKAVYPGDTITCRSRVISCRESGSRPGSGIVTWKTEARDQAKRLVLNLERTNLVRKRSR